MTALLPGLMKRILRGRLAHDHAFALLLAERLPAPADPVDYLLEAAARAWSSPESALDPDVFETLGLEEECCPQAIPSRSA